MNRKKLLYIIGGVAAAVAILAMLYCRFASVTRVATLNFPDFTVEKFIRSNDNPFIKINPIGLDEAEKIAKYDIVLVRIHGSSLNGTHLQAIQKAIAKGVPVYATESDNPEINTLSGRELEYIDALMANGSIQNYRSLFNYVRKHIDRKALFNEPYAENQDATGREHPVWRCFRATSTCRTPTRSTWPPSSIPSKNAG